MKRSLFGILLFLLLTGAVICHAGVQASVLSAGERCVQVLIPSLYFFSILAACCIRSGILTGLSGRRFGNTDCYLLAVVLFSQIGGYPVGAQLLHGMRTSGILSAEQERRMLCICIGCGPGFLLGTVCGRLPLAAGMWILLSVSLPNILLAFLIAKGEYLPEVRSQSASGAALLTESVESAASAMLKICGMVIGVAAVLGILDETGLFRIVGTLTPSAPERTAAFLKTIAEVSCITEFIQNGGSLPMAAALLSFGGICVHLQAAAICEGNLPWLKFWTTRLLCSGVTYAVCRLGIQWFFPNVTPAALMIQNHAAVYSGSVIPGLCLMVMSVLLLKRQKFL